MDHLRYSGKIRTVRDVLPHGLHEDDVLAELKEIREYATMRRRETAIMAVGVLAILWVVAGEWPLFLLLWSSSTESPQWLSSSGSKEKWRD